jgi:DNA invertase Pin-like site-specific DNA recombinase
MTARRIEASARLTPPEARATTNERQAMAGTNGTAGPTRAATYRRVSTDKQEQHGYSLDDQDRSTRELAERDGYEIVATYTDVLSGADPDRDGFNRMLDDAIAGRFERIYIAALDRFGRDVLQITTSLRLLDAARVEVVPVRGTIDRATPEGQMMTTIEAAFAEFERAKIKVRTRMGIAGKVRAGIPHGPARFGYATGEDLNWIVRPDEAELAERIYTMRVVDGMSYHAIARTLNAEGFKTRYSKRWSATQVRMIIESKHVRGFFLHAGEWHTGRHEPIIDESLWSAAQAMVGRDAKFTGSRRGRRPRRHLFINGQLRCSLCGQPMHARSGSTPDADRYVCATTRMQGADACPTGWHKRSDVDADFLSIFEQTHLDLDATRDRMEAELNRNLADVVEQLASAESEVARIEDQQQRVEADYLAQELGAAAYDRLSTKLDQDAGAAVAERDRLSDNAERVRSDRGNLDAGSETLRRLAAIRDTIADRARGLEQQADLEALRAVVSTMAENVLLGADGRIAGITPGVRMMEAIYQQNGAAEIELPRYAVPLAGATNEMGNSRTL